MASCRPSRRPRSGLRGLVLGTTKLGCPLIQLLSAAEFVAFESDSINLVPGDFRGATHGYVRDLELGTTRLASANTNGMPSPGSEARNPLVSADGRYEVFTRFTHATW